MPLPRINPMSHGQITIEVVDDLGQDVLDATIRADVYQPNGVIVANDVEGLHFSGSAYILEIVPEWSTMSGDNGPEGIQGRYRAYCTITTPDELQDVERVTWICAYDPED